MMYTILHLNCSKDVINFTTETLQQVGEDIQIFSCRSIDNAKEILQNHTIQCMIADLHKNTENTISFLQEWQSNADGCQNAVIFIAENKEIVLYALQRLHFCESIIDKMSEENKRVIGKFLKQHYALHQQLSCLLQAEVVKNSINLKISQSILNCKLNDILFVEAFKHKCIIHTVHEQLESSLPLCKLRNSLAVRGFKQSHRSFLINPAHIKQIDTTSSPWVIHFYDSEKHAFVSRGFKKSFEEDILGS